MIVGVPRVGKAIVPMDGVFKEWAEVKTPTEGGAVLPQEEAEVRELAVQTSWAKHAAPPGL